MSVNVAAIRQSFEIARPIGSQIVERFYENLFADYPQARPLFAQVDMAKQREALLGSLVAAVDNLDNPNVLTKFLFSLGERHYRYGVESAHYEWVGQTLLKTFGQFFGAAWTEDLRNQWAEVYSIMAEVMKTGARKAASVGSNVVSMPKKAASPTGDAASSAVYGHGFPSLTEGMRATIRSSVRTYVDNLIRAEIKSAFDEEMARISAMSPEELLRKAG